MVIHDARETFSENTFPFARNSEKKKPYPKFAGKGKKLVPGSIANGANILWTDRT